MIWKVIYIPRVGQMSVCSALTFTVKNISVDVFLEQEVCSHTVPPCISLARTQHWMKPVELRVRISEYKPQSFVAISSCWEIPGTRELNYTHFINLLSGVCSISRCMQERVHHLPSLPSSQACIPERKLCLISFLSFWTSAAGSLWIFDSFHFSKHVCIVLKPWCMAPGANRSSYQQQLAAKKLQPSEIISLQFKKRLSQEVKW